LGRGTGSRLADIIIFVTDVDDLPFLSTIETTAVVARKQPFPTSGTEFLDVVADRFRLCLCQIPGFLKPMPNFFSAWPFGNDLVSGNPEGFILFSGPSMLATWVLLLRRRERG
jgi:hypothetical protein